jgi:hypothetical protein
MLAPTRFAMRKLSLGIAHRRDDMGNPIQRIIVVVIAVLVAVCAILGLLYPTEIVVTALREFALGALFGALAMLIAGRKKPS